MSDEPWGAPLAEWIGWWWLSFANGERPKGSQFLGVAIVRGLGIADAVMEAHRLGVNPGGDVAGVSLPFDRVPIAKYRNRLLNKADANEAGDDTSWEVPPMPVLRPTP